MPLLHRPTFGKSVANGLHLKDNSFGAIVLLVCALGSRYSDDPRVFLEGSDSTHTCGWKWFIQVQTIQKSLLATTSLYDLQYYCVRLKRFSPSTSYPAPKVVGPIHAGLQCPSHCLLDKDRHWNSPCPGRRSSSQEGVQPEAYCGGRTLETGVLVSVYIHCTSEVDRVHRSKGTWFALIEW
jgi:hypothetical protein